MSTGVDAFGNPLPIGSSGSWMITSSPVGSLPAVVSSAHPIWLQCQPMPVPGTNANWVNPISTYYGQVPGVYVYENSFNVPFGATNLTLNFGVAFDDVLLSLELIPPTGPAIPLSVTLVSGMYCVSSLPTPGIISSPAAGVWTIRAKVDYIDSVGGFLLSGDVRVDECQRIAKTSVPVSTGIALPVGGVDPDWSITSSPVGAVPAIVCPSYLPYWEPTPVGVTNANWLNPTSSYFNQVPGDYVYERSFNVPANTFSMYLNFGIAYDDALISLELVPPYGPTIPLTVVPGSPNQYFISPFPTPGTISNPVSGVWTIRATVKYIDSVGGFLLSGDVVMEFCADRCQYIVKTDVPVSSGISLPVGGVDPDWSITSSPIGAVPAIVCPSYLPYWQPTPVTGTLANWLNPTSTYFYQVPGDYEYTRSFTVPANTYNMSLYFGIAYDDDLISLELVPPYGPSIPLTVVPGSPYFISSFPTPGVIGSPVAGVWKIVAKVNYYDSVGGFLLSGDISMVSCKDRRDNEVPTKRPATSASAATIYPNPATSEVHIPNPAAGTRCDLILSNTIGQVMTTRSFEEAETTVNLSDFPAGMYILTLTSEGVTRSEKLVKE